MDPRSGDLYDADMGDDVFGGNVQFDYRGRGYDHYSVYGYGRHFSWDTDPYGDVYGLHLRDDVADETIAQG